VINIIYIKSNTDTSMLLTEFFDTTEWVKEQAQSIPVEAKETN
jgi:hypothetical protein